MDVPGICSSNMKCCVSKQIFEGENIPAGLVIPSRNTNQNQKPDKPEVTTTSSPRSPQEPTSKPKQSSDSDTCSGTCVSGFLALLCDEIDRTATCPGNARCCLTKKVDSKPQNKRPAKPIKCPGFCLPQSMSSLCSNPSNILHNTNSCNKGTVCCESKSSNGVNERTPAPKR